MKAYSSFLELFMSRDQHLIAQGRDEEQKKIKGFILENIVK